VRSGRGSALRAGGSWGEGEAESRDGNAALRDARQERLWLSRRYEPACECNEPPANGASPGGHKLVYVQRAPVLEESDVGAALRPRTHKNGLCDGASGPPEAYKPLAAPGRQARPWAQGVGGSRAATKKRPIDDVRRRTAALREPRGLGRGRGRRAAQGAPQGRSARVWVLGLGRSPVRSLYSGLV